MNKINWQNSPSTATPINAENLNQMQTNIEDAIAKNILSAIGSQNITALSMETTMPLQLSSKIGNKININSNGNIEISDGISYVKVSAKGMWSSRSAGTKSINIYKNSTLIQRAILNTNTETIQPTLVIPTFLFSVQQGDVISLKFSSSTNDTISGTYSGLTIEEA